MANFTNDFGASSGCHHRNCSVCKDSTSATMNIPQYTQEEQLEYFSCEQQDMLHYDVDL